MGLASAGAVVTAAAVTPMYIGFSAGGGIAGSTAAAIQSGIGNVVAGSAFATA